MRRQHLFEIEDQPWCPTFLRDAVTELLQFVIELADVYQPVVPRLRRALEHQGEHRIVDLASGGGGPWLGLQHAFAEAGYPLTVRLTDRYPNLPAFRRMQVVSHGRIQFDAKAVDATAVPGDLPGFRTLFSSFHHFRPMQARALLADAVRCRRGIGVFEAAQRQPSVLLLACLLPVAVVLLTPFVRPFRWSRLLWTYLIPVIPLIVLFDGLVSCLRSYTLAELRELTEGLSDAYMWEVGEVRGCLWPVPVTYLLGYPRAAARGA